MIFLLLSLLSAIIFIFAVVINMSLKDHTKLWFKKLKDFENYWVWFKNMIFIIEFENLDKIVFEKIKKSERSKTEKELDELEFKQLIKKQEKKSTDRE